MLEPLREVTDEAVSTTGRREARELCVPAPIRYMSQSARLAKVAGYDGSSQICMLSTSKMPKSLLARDPGKMRCLPAKTHEDGGA